VMVTFALMANSDWRLMSQPASPGSWKVIVFWGRDRPRC
jgi:hypothetical protein